MCGETSNAIGMRFGVRKCGTAHMQKGKVLAVPDNPERSEESIKGLEKGTTYKYLELEQLFEVDDSKVKACLINDLRRRLHKCGALTSMVRMLQKPLTCCVPLY